MLLAAVAERDFAAGEYDTSSVRVGGGENRARVSIDRSNFAALSGHVLDLEMLVARDGVNYEFLCSIQVAGGEIIGNDGAVVTHSILEGAWVPWKGQTDRRVKLRLRAARAVRLALTAEIAVGPEPTLHAARNSVAHAQSNDASGTAVTGLTQSLTIAADTDRCIIAAVGANDNEAGLGGSPTVTWNTTESLTDISPASSWPYVTAAFNDDGIMVWRRIAPTATTANLVFAGHTSGNRLYFSWMVAYGVDQTTPNNAAVLNFGTTGSSATGSCTGATDGLAFGICFHSRSASPTLTDGGGQTGRAEEEGIGGRCAGSIATIAGSGTLNFDWTLGGSGSTEAWGVVLVPIRASGLSVTVVDDGIGGTAIGSLPISGNTPVVSGTTYDVGATDGVKAGDPASGSLEMFFADTEGVKAGDSAGGALEMVDFAAADGIKAGDTGEGGLQYDDSATDGVKGGDTGASLLEIPGDGTEGTKGGDAAGGALDIEGAGADGAKAGDAAGGTLEMDAAGADGVKAGDEGMGGFDVDLSAADGVKAGDAGDGGIDRTEAAVDGLKAGDTAGTPVEMAPEASDGIKAGDASGGLLEIGGAAVDGVKGGDAGDGGIDRTETAADGVKGGDAAGGALEIGGAGADGMKAGDAANTPVEMAPSATDGARAGETAGGALEMNAAGVEGALAGDTGVYQLEIHFTAGEGVALGDSAEEDVNTILPNTVKMVLRLLPAVAEFAVSVPSFEHEVKAPQHEFTNMTPSHAQALAAATMEAEVIQWRP